MGASGLRQRTPTDREFSVRKEHRHEWSGRQVRHETMLNLFRRGEVLPEGRTNEEEAGLIGGEKGGGGDGSPPRHLGGYS